MKKQTGLERARQANQTPVGNMTAPLSDRWTLKQVEHTFNPTERQLNPSLLTGGVITRHETGLILMRCPVCRTTNMHRQHEKVGPDEKPTIRNRITKDLVLNCTCGACKATYQIKDGTASIVDPGRKGRKP